MKAYNGSQVKLHQDFGSDNIEKFKVDKIKKEKKNEGKTKPHTLPLLIMVCMPIIILVMMLFERIPMILRGQDVNIVDIVSMAGVIIFVVSFSVPIIVKSRRKRTDDKVAEVKTEHKNKRITEIESEVKSIITDEDRTLSDNIITEIQTESIKRSYIFNHTAKPALIGLAMAFGGIFFVSLSPIFLLVGFAGLIVGVTKGILWAKQNNVSLKDLWTTLEQEDLHMKYTEELIEPVFRKFYPNGMVTLSKSTAFDASIEDLQKFGVIPKGNSPDCHDAIQSGESDDLEFALSNITVKHVTKDSDGHRHTSVRFVGQVIQLPLSSMEDSKVYIVASKKLGAIINKETTGCYNVPKSHMEKIETEDQSFNEEFEVYATDDTAGFYVLNPATMSSLKNLKQSYNEFAIYIENGQMYIGLNTGSYVLSLPEKISELSDVTVDSIYIDIMLLLNMIKDLEKGISGREYDIKY